MKKILRLGLLLTALFMLTACGKDSAKEPEKTEPVLDTEADKPADCKEVTGALVEKKDFMFTIECEDGAFYALSFEEKPEGYDDLQEDDVILVEYTGELSEVDAFTGEIVSITVQE